MKTMFLAAQMFLAAHGGIIGGGGDADVYEFQQIAQVLADRLDQWGEGAIPGVSPARFRAEVLTFKVDSADRVYDRSGVERDAVTDADARAIHIGRIRWRLLRDEPSKKVLLVFHEATRVLGVPDEQYELSARFMFKMNQGAECSNLDGYWVFEREAGGDLLCATSINQFDQIFLRQEGCHHLKSNWVGKSFYRLSLPMLIGTQQQGKHPRTGLPLDYASRWNDDGRKLEIRVQAKASENDLYDQQYVLSRDGDALVLEHSERRKQGRCRFKREL